jgi:hypothetical protein
MILRKTTGLRGALLLCGAVLLGLAAAPPARGQTTESRPAREDHIETLIAKLGDASYGVRADAMRDLIAIGPDTLPMLRKAAQADDMEIALRAEEVIRAFERIMFAGTTVDLRAEPNAVRWDQPFTLEARITNHSSEPCRIPFALAEHTPWTVSAEAEQVGAMLDLADYLIVKGPDGHIIRLSTEPIDEDPAVEMAVRWRVEAEPVESLDGGRTLTFKADDFNRGWARYRMLDAGEYTVQFVCEPQWDDVELAKGQVGRVASEVIRIRVTQAAPEAIRKAERPLAGEVKLKDDKLVAYITNTWDRPLYVNTNRGSDPRRDAMLTWYLRTESGQMFEYEPSPEKEAFSLAKIVRLEPGERVAVAQITRAEAAAAIGEEGTLAVDGPHGFVYANFLRRGTARPSEWAGLPEDREAFEQIARELPPHIYTGQLHCVPAQVQQSKLDVSNLERVDIGD